MLTAVMIIAGLLGGFGGVFAIAAAGCFKRGLEWPDYVVLIVPLVALESIIAAFCVLPLHFSILLSIVLVAAVWWSLLVLLKVPSKRRVTTN